MRRKGPGKGGKKQRLGDHVLFLIFFLIHSIVRFARRLNAVRSWADVRGNLNCSNWVGRRINRGSQQHPQDGFKGQGRLGSKR